MAKRRKIKLITVLCSRPGFRRFGRSWPAMSMVEVVEGPARQCSDSSPAAAAITEDDFAELQAMVEYEAEPGRPNNCPLSFQDPEESSVAVAEAEAKRAEILRDIEAKRAERDTLANRVQETERELAAQAKKLEAAERKCAEYEARAEEAERAAAHVQADYEKAKAALESMNAPSRPKSG